jgi:hypothetical protein
MKMMFYLIMILSTGVWMCDVEEGGIRVFLIGNVSASDSGSADCTLGSGEYCLYDCDLVSADCTIAAGKNQHTLTN